MDNQTPQRGEAGRLSFAHRRDGAEQRSGGMKENRDRRIRLCNGRGVLDM